MSWCYAGEQDIGTELKTGILVEEVGPSRPSEAAKRSRDKSFLFRHYVGLDMG